MRSSLSSLLCFLLLPQLEKLEPGQSGVASWVVDVILCSNDLLTKGIIHTSWLRLPPWRWSCSPGSLWSPLGSALCWELAELLLLRSWLESLWLRCWPLPLRRLRSRLETLGLRCGLLGCARRRGVGLELTEGLPLLRTELLLLNSKVLGVNLEMAGMRVLLVSSGPECSCSRLLLRRCRTELLLLRLHRSWPELLLGGRLELLLGGRLEPLLLRLWLELLLLRLELLLRSRLESLLLLWLTKLLNGDRLACLVNELGDHLTLGARNVEWLLTRLSKDGELSRLQLDGGGRAHTLLLGKRQGGDGEDEGTPHAGADLDKIGRAHV